MKYYIGKSAVIDVHLFIYFKRPYMQEPCSIILLLKVPKAFIFLP